MKISRKRMIRKRVAGLRRKIRIDTQKIRRDLLTSLREIFNLASSLARGEFGTQTLEGNKVKVTLKQRHAWARVAAYTAQTMNSIAEGFDEREIDVQLDELERLVNEAEAKEKAREAEQGISQTKGARDPERQS